MHARVSEWWQSWWAGFLFCWLAFVCCSHATELKPGAHLLSPPGALELSNLRCEYAANPIGVEAMRPRLSWALESRQRNQRQTAYQILVASTPELLRANQADLWDSGRVQSDQSIQVQ